jgi:NAD+ synthase
MSGFSEQAGTAAAGGAKAGGGIDFKGEVGHILASITGCVKALGRKGAVVPTSGGIDSATVLKLSAMALGPANVRAIFLPDGSSSPESEGFAKQAVAAAGVQEMEYQDISGAVAALTSGQAAGIVRKYLPEFDEGSHGYSLELNMDDSIRLGTPCYDLATGRLHEDPDKRFRIRAEDLRALIANQNVKQRLRMVCAYRLAEKLHYAVGGTSNLDEAEFGFAVKHGDAASDYYPMILLRKPEVIALAAAIGVPQSIIDRTPTTDTYSLKQSQQKFFFGISPAIMRLALSEAASDEQVAEEAGKAGFTGGNVKGLRRLVRFLSASGTYNNSQFFLDPQDGWKFKLLREMVL